MEGKTCHPYNDCQKEHSCKVLQQTPGLQPLWEVFESCKVVPLTAGWQHQRTALAALQCTAQLL